VSRNALRLGGWCHLPDPHVVECVAKSGVDFVGIDLQHGMIDFGDAARALQVLNLVGVPGLVRLGHGRLDQIPRVLDMGAAGVVIPMVEDARTVQAAVAACRLPPEGSRSYAPPRLGLLGRRELDRAEVHIMVETREVMAQLDEILAVPGLTGTFIGYEDLALGLGFWEDARRDELLREAAGKVVAACAQATVSAGIFAQDGAVAARWAALGFSTVVVSSDIGLLSSSAKREVAVARGTLPADMTSIGKPDAAYQA
jgi:4-hydroxy-2-oxoheptanedioate aldolase